MKGEIVTIEKGKKPIRKFDMKSDVLDYTFGYNKAEGVALHRKLNNAPSITVEDLRRVSLWKLDRVMDVPEETLQKLNTLAISEVQIDDPLVEDVLNRLVFSQGIGFPMASTILKFIKPNVFPIIDVRAYRALTGKKLYYTTYSYEKYVEYAKSLAKIAAHTKRPLREIDEQLYCFDKKHNVKI